MNHVHESTIVIGSFEFPVERNSGAHVFELRNGRIGQRRYEEIDRGIAHNVFVHRTEDQRENPSGPTAQAAVTRSEIASVTKKSVCRLFSRFPVPAAQILGGDDRPRLWPGRRKRK